MADDDILARIPDVLAWIRRQPPSDWMTRAADALEAAQELEAERDEFKRLFFKSEVNAAVEKIRAEKAEAERDQLRDELKQPHQAAVLRAKQAEAEATRYRESIAWAIEIYGMPESKRTLEQALAAAERETSETKPIHRRPVDMRPIPPEPSHWEPSE